MTAEMKMASLIGALFILFSLIVRGGCNAQTCMEHKIAPERCKSEFYRP